MRTYRALSPAGERAPPYAGLLRRAELTVLKPGYAEWTLEDPRVNFAISTRAEGGVRHLGIQAESGEELQEVYGRLRAADAPVLGEGAATCCCAKPEKS